jgi:hypothetical protein
MTATISKLYNAKYSISFNNNPYSRDTIFTFTPQASDSLLINIIDSLSPTCPAIIEKIGYVVDTLIDQDTGSLIKFTASLCENSYLYNVKSLYTAYEFYKNNVLMNSGTNASYTYTGLVNGDKLTAIGKINSCQKVYGPVTVALNSKPVSTYTYVRSWKNYTLTATDNTLTEYKWYVGNTAIGTGSVLISDFTAYDNSTVDVKLVAKNSGGCVDSSTQSVTVPKFSSINAFQSGAFKLYPNPFNSQITIESELAEYEVQIVSSIGQVIYSNVETASVQHITTSEWASGMYHIVIKDTDNRISRYTFIKQ